MEVELTIKRAANLLKKVKGIEAVVLGGSRAKGNYSDKSDIDIGIYYSDRSQLDLKELNRAATELDDAHRSNLITKIGEWGPWINGGGWLHIDGLATDFLLRDINRASSVIDDCLNKKITIEYQPGHPHGFVNAIYAAETYYCKIIWDTNNIITKLKEKVTPYPLPIKNGIIDKFLWEADFSKEIAYKGLLKNDNVYAVGCIYRAVSCLIQVIYALNETYIMNEKGALANMGTFRIIPKNFKKKVESILYSLAVDNENTKNLIDEFSVIIKEVEDLCSIYK